MRTVGPVSAVLDQGVSANGKARRALVEVRVPSASAARDEDRAVDNLRCARPSPPPGHPRAWPCT